MSLEPGPLLTGKIAVVTGAGAGAGRHIALAFGAHGATVVIAGLDPDQLSETADGIAEAGGKVIPVVADLTRRADVGRLAGLAGEVEILVNNPGPPTVANGFLESSFLESREEDWEGFYEVSLKPLLLCCRAMVPGMIERDRGGSVINIASRADDLTGAHQAAFQGGVTRFTRSLAKELGGYRIRVNAIGGRHGRSSQSEDLAGVALFLASDLSSLVTGTAIRADGPSAAERPEPF
jgi:NAD(P)-dependent dehydrogenase (short-subunit alcohol dehydrogenase family)